MVPGHSCTRAEGPLAPAGVRRGPGGRGRSEEGTFFFLGMSQQRGVPGECGNHRWGHGGPEGRTPTQVPGAGTSVRAQIPAHLRIPNFLEGSEQTGTEMLRLEQEEKPSQPPGPSAFPVCAFQCHRAPPLGPSHTWCYHRTLLIYYPRYFGASLLISPDLGIGRGGMSREDSAARCTRYLPGTRNVPFPHSTNTYRAHTACQVCSRREGHGNE